MLKHGHALTRVDSGEGLSFFIEMYKCPPELFAVTQDLTGNTFLTPDKIAHIAYVESDGTIGQLFSLQKGDTMIVSREARLHSNDSYGITNSQHMAFFTLMRDGEMIAKFAADSGPFDSDDESLSWCDTTREEMLQKIRNVLATAPDTYPVTISNTLLFQQL